MCGFFKNCLTYSCISQNDLPFGMLKKERQNYILHQVNLHNRVLSSDLSMQMNVSEDTIRRDLLELSENGKVIKVHGGALSRSFNSSLYNGQVYSLDHKKLIAYKAAQLIEDGMFVLTTGGTTIIELARALPEGLKATFITGSLPAAIEYLHHPNIDLVVIGDKVSKSSKITIGGDAIKRIGSIRADLCFLGINAIDVSHGLTDNDWDVVEVKKAMIEASKRTVVLTISEKINTHQKIQISGLDEIDTLVSELPPDETILQPYRQAGLTIL